jgi:hypothetical protein
MFRRLWYPFREKESSKVQEMMSQQKQAEENPQPAFF